MWEEEVRCVGGGSEVCVGGGSEVWEEETRRKWVCG